MGILRTKRFWFGLAVFISLVFAVFYLGLQQAYRSGADEPQTSMVDDVVTKLNDGRRPDSLVSGRIDMARDMAPFVIIYDTYGKVVKGSGYIDGNVPQVPIGVLQASDKGAHHVTWEPKAGVRIAAVSMKAGDNYVLGGRNLEVVEKEISSVTSWVAAAWLVSLVLLAILYRLLNRKKHTAKPDEPEQA